MNFCNTKLFEDFFCWFSFEFVKLDEPSVYVGTCQVISLLLLSSMLPVIFLFITCLYLGENKHLTYYLKGLE